MHFVCVNAFEQYEEVRLEIAPDREGDLWL